MNKLYGLLLIVLLFSCKRESDLPPLQPDEFTTTQRAQLGARLNTAIVLQPEAFPLRQISNEQDSVLLNYLQWQYDQATYFYRFDPTLPEDQRWTQNSSWKIHLVDQATPFAFTLPGGAHYISKGLLQTLQGSEQLFALLSLEATRMQKRFLFYKLIERFSTNKILEVIEKGQTANGLEGIDLVNEIISTIYDPEILQQLDFSTQTHICRSSIFDPQGLSNIEAIFRQENTDWINRKSYSGRSSYLQNLLETAATNCGQRADEGEYQIYILENL